MSEFDIIIVGGGIIGVTTAINLQRKYPNVKITIVTDRLSPHTTGDVSAGFWMPYLCGSTPSDKVVQWSSETLKYFHHLWRSELAETVGVTFLPAILLLNEQNDDNTEPPWFSLCHGVHEIPLNTIQKLMKEHRRQYRQGYYFTSFTCEPVKLLPYLLDQFLRNGGNVVYNRVNKLSEVVQQYSDGTKKVNVIVNCCGLAAKTVVSDDRVYPIRGQVARVHAPWQFHIIMSGENYIIPNYNAVILGGTHQENDYSTEVYNDDSKLILNGCQELVPGLKHSWVINEWVGLRPGRDSVRLEIDNMPSKFAADDNRKSSLIVIHNYGHGGCGVTLSWGCAINVTNLLENALSDFSLSSTNSKLQNTCSNFQSRL